MVLVSLVRFCRARRRSEQRQCWTYPCNSSAFCFIRVVQEHVRVVEHMRREIRGHLRHIGQAIWAVTAEYLRRLVHQRRSPAGHLKAHMIHDEDVTGNLSS